MNAEIKKTARKPTVTRLEPYAKERGMFKTLLLTNPNYFGNLIKTKLKPVLLISGNIYYEELGCVGYHPQQKFLEGVVYINQPSGYGSDICGPGSPEYVRFYLSFDGGATWDDQGMTSFQAYNIPEGTEGTKRLEYAVSLPVKPAAKLCFSDPLIRLRAILSWNNPPPPNQPNWNPVWGNHRETIILVEPRRFIFPPEIFTVAKIKQPPWLEELLPLDLPIQTEPKALKAIELAEMYKGKAVPLHRYAFKEISGYVHAKINLDADAFATILPGIKIDTDIWGKLFPKTDGDISYEELKCVGLDPNTPDTLIGVIQVKKQLGYSGGPCTHGSVEYVTFWGDFDGNGSFDICLGMASVRVYDVEIPEQGVYYAVRLPVDLTQYRQPCKQGPKLVRIRAILSWNVAVPCNEPGKVPTWGNREETLINISPIPGTPAGKIAILGGIPVSFINVVSGLTTPEAIFATNNLPPDNPDGNINTPDSRPCPFGGRVTVQGAPLVSYSYKVEVTPAGGGAPTAVVTDLTLTRQDGTTWTHKADPLTLRFTYVDFYDNINSVLAQWDTTGNDKWAVKLTTYDSGGNPIGIDTHLIQLNNTPPVASIDITTGPGNCGKFSIGTLLEGNFVARDDYLSVYYIAVSPNVNLPGVGVPSPASGMVNTAPAPGDPWKLDTTLMVPCGYVIWVKAVERTIWDSQWTGNYRTASAGFCLDNGKTKKNS